MASEKKHARRAWLQLLRPWELLILPGAVLAGAALSDGLQPFAGWPIIGVLGIALLIGAAKRLLNGYLNPSAERATSPSQPLPSNRNSRRARLLGTVACLAGAVGIAMVLCAEISATACVLIVLMICP